MYERVGPDSHATSFLTRQPSRIGLIFSPGTRYPENLETRMLGFFSEKKAKMRILRQKRKTSLTLCGRVGIYRQAFVASFVQSHNDF